MMFFGLVLTCLGGLCLSFRLAPPGSARLVSLAFLGFSNEPPPWAPRDAVSSRAVFTVSNQTDSCIQYQIRVEGFPDAGKGPNSYTDFTGALRGYGTSRFTVSASELTNASSFLAVTTIWRPPPIWQQRANKFVESFGGPSVFDGSITIYPPFTNEWTTLSADGQNRPLRVE